MAKSQRRGYKRRKRVSRRLRLKISEFRRKHRSQNGCGIYGCNMNHQHQHQRGGGVIFQPITDAKNEMGALAGGIQNTILGTNDTSLKLP